MLTSTSYDHNDTITVIVGEEEKHFTVHKDTICVKSKFFRAACSDHWLEGQQKVVRLTGARSVQAFQTYMDWTYTNELVVENLTTRTRHGDHDYIIELYLLGDILEDVKIRNRSLQLLDREITTTG